LLFVFNSSGVPKSGLFNPQGLSAAAGAQFESGKLHRRSLITGHEFASQPLRDGPKECPVCDMTDVFLPEKRSLVMGLIRGTGNKDTELRMIKIFRAFGITGWRRAKKIHGKRRG
jgi:hypothetical protein